MIYNCIQQKGIRRKYIKDNYKQKIKKCKSSVFCRIVNFLFYFFQNLVNWIQFLICVVIGFLKLFPIWIYELFRFCPFKKVKSPLPDFLIIGHRGAAAYEIENTLPAIEKAINQYHANAVEIDLSLTKDNEIVLWHDWNPENLVAVIRQMGLEPHVKYRPFVPTSGMWRKPVNKLYLSELRQHYGYAFRKKYPEKLDVDIPTLKEFLDFTRNQSQLKAVLFDIKIPVEDLDTVALFAHLFSNLIEEFNPKYRIILLSPEKEIIKAFKNYMPGEFYSYDVELPLGIVLDPKYFSSTKAAIELKNSNASIGRPTALQLAPWTTYRRVVEFDKKTQDNFNQSNPDVPVEKLIAWTINYKHEMKCLMKMGVDGVLTDKPDKLSKLLN